MADIAIVFIKDHEWSNNGRPKKTLKGTRMVGDPEFLGQFLKAKAAKEAGQKVDVVKEIMKNDLEKE